MKLLAALYLLLLTINQSTEDIGDRPVIRANNGDLIIEPAHGRNIIIRTTGISKAYFNDIDITQILREVKARYDPVPPSSGQSIDDPVGPGGTLNRLDRLEDRSALISYNTSIMQCLQQVNLLSRRIRRVESQINYINDILFKNDCSLNPCKNGGTCQRIVNGYFCQCPSNWEGTDCDVDVNECRNFAGTDLGCQNGATCVNRQGSYECSCPSGWFGMHCTRRSMDCSGGNSEMCGHGTCIPTKTGTGILCICDQGWTNNATGQACTTDVNECEMTQSSHCSVNPKVECVNLPGSFRCGVCPSGYEGDGYRCFDIDECAENNGGCSKNPHVACHNTIGSRICGACPSGFQGDGTTCTWRGTCSINNGGCHPSAKCNENLAISAQFVQCVCPLGMLGDGVGISGCYIPSGHNLNLTDCRTNPCGLHGQCHMLEKGITCVCAEGYKGSFCDLRKDYCADNPCLNNGVCTSDTTAPTGYRCECTAQYSGLNCQNRVRTCVSLLDSPSGNIVYPLTNVSRTYNDNSRCVWLIKTTHNKVINVTFTKFSLEPSHTCSYDFLQIHDGRSTASQIIGRFCGSELPKGGNILSSANFLYLWFHSDQSLSHEGFSLHWKSIVPICGGEIDATRHGTISSPGSPGNYPPNRDCVWKLSTSPSKRIKLSFSRLDLEVHANCSFDYLEIFDGIHSSDPILKRYCNTSLPAPLESTGSNMLIHFHSDASNSGEGFQIAYFPENGCGGLYTHNKGEITSPSYNEKYMENLQCDYKIQLPPDSKIKLIISKFEVESSRRCNFDHLEIYDGPDSDSKLVGRFCGRVYPKIFVSSSNIIYMRFKTDETVGLGGFKILYELVCKETITGDSGVFKSPGYPHSYPADRICEYFISTSPGKIIQVSFQHFDIEDNRNYNCQYDNVEVRDGPNVNSSLLGRFCDENVPAMQTSTFNYMYIRFTSDLSISGTGFLANFSTYDVSCGGIHTSQTGIISHPVEGNSIYENNQQCKWIILAPLGHTIRIIWSRFDIEQVSKSCSSDYVEISERQEDGKDISYERFCGTKLPSAITSSSNELKIAFQSDSSVVKGGFSLVYIISDSKTYCGGNYVGSHGSIKSPGWPNNYQNAKDCIWTVKVPVGQQIILNISRFDVELSRMCNNDFLEIRNGPSDNSPLIGRYCGNTIPKRIPSHSNSLYLHFHSDSNMVRQGFSIEWDGTTTGCGGTLTSSTGVITSPNYPQDYHEDAECFWRIIVSRGSAIRIAFTDIDLEHSHQCSTDYIEIYDGHDASSNELGRYCSMDIRTSAIISKTNQLFIKFRSDISIGGKGFSLNYYTECNVQITGFSGVIESPDFPNSYPLNLNCIWTISVPRGNKINVTFTHFGLQNYLYNSFGYSPWVRHRLIYRMNMCHSDYLQVKTNKNEDFKETRKLCGNALPSKYVSKDNFLQIHLVTGSYSGFSRTKGFRLEWVSDGCGGTIKKSYGIISPPSARRGLGEPTECEWLVETPAGTAVQIHFFNLNMREDANCTVDRIEIYNGPNDLSPLIMKICHRQEQVYQAVSTSNVMFIRLIATSGYAGLDFRSRFDATQSKCGGQISGNSGIITSPNYPKNYERRLNCVWYIHVPRNHRLKFDILDLDLYSSTINSCEDSLQIFDGNDVTRKNYTRKYCNAITSDVLKSYTAKGNNIVVQFTSGDHGAKGFKANFSFTCGAQIISHGEGFITNDDSVAMHAHQNCTWTILSDKPEQKVSLTLTYLSLSKSNEILTSRQCPSDFLKVFDGNDDQAPLKGEYCNRKVPPTIVSQGNALTVQLGSYAESVNGKFSAHYSVLDTACGGNLFSEQGTITSPSYPGTYSIDTDCEWVLKTSPGNRVSLTFVKFDLESSQNCNEDYVEVRDTNGSGKLLGVYCGSEIPVNVTSAKQLYIKFHSDTMGTAPGFVADYTFMHGNEITDQTSGDISSPLFPHYYQGAGEYSWRINTASSSYISLVLSQLEIDVQGSVCYNYLAIYDGYDDTAPVLKLLCGILNPEDKDIRTTSNMLFIKMYLDDSNYRSQFFLHWMEVENDATYETSSHRSNCGFNETIIIFPHSSTEIESPNYPKNYGDNLDCEWIYQTNPGRHLKIQFDNFQLEESQDCFMDYMRIYSGVSGTNDWHAITEQLCLPTVKFETFVNTTNLIKVIFHSDIINTKSGFHGNVSSVCGGILTETSGIIEFTRLDIALNSSFTTCNWKVKVRPRRTIVIQINRFYISRDDTTCSNNYVSLRNGESRDSPVLGSSSRYCGVNHDLDNLETTGNALFVSLKIRNIDFNTLDGFRLRYDEKSVDCGSSTILDAIESWKEIYSMNFPQPPLPYSECLWTILAPPGEVLRLQFIDRFDLASRTQSENECIQEYIEVRDGATENSPLIGRFCGRGDLGTILKTTGNTMFIKYTTLLLEPNDGFKANISIDVCGGTLRSSGEITSPSYPKYSNLQVGTVCEWRLLGRAGKLLWINPLDLSLPDSEQPCGIKVVVEDYLPSNMTRVIQNTYCTNNRNLEPIRSFSDEVLIKFYVGKPTIGTDTSRFRGFRLSFNSSGASCGDTINTASGLIQTPGYPIRSNARFCTWKIKVPDESSRIRLEILDFDVEDAGFMLGIYYDLDFTAPIEYITTIDSTKRVFESSRNTMGVTFIGRRSNSLRRGFKAQFTSNKPKICGGMIEGESGFIESPFRSDNQSYFCQWHIVSDNSINYGFQNIDDNESETRIHMPNNISLYMKINITSPTLTNKNGCSRVPWVRFISVGHRYDGYYFYREFCTNHENEMRIPAPQININSYRKKGDSLNFNIMWKVQPCGGVVEVGEKNDDILNIPATFNGSLDCAWFVKKKARTSIHISLEGTFGLPCSQEYLRIFSSILTSSPLKEYCQGNTLEIEIPINLRHIYIDYHTNYYSNKTNIKLKVTYQKSNSCGGVLTEYDRLLMTPNYPKSYSNNQECIWDISTTLGNTVSLKFIDRFQLEDSSNCTKDYLLVYDWKREDYFEVSRFCGRTRPEAINSTSNRMKVIFRSDGTTQADGFKAYWEPMCGGEYLASEEEQFLYSPNYPEPYPRLSNCYYKINASDNQVVIKFVSFNLENNDGMACSYDNLTITGFETPWSDPSSTIYCGDELPETISYRDGVHLRFRTDGQIQRRGFKIVYKLKTCGGQIQKHAIITSGDLSGNYEDNLNCIWNITAPANKNVVVRFTHFDLEDQYHCNMDYVAIFNGYQIDDENRTALLCGHLNTSLPVFRSTSSSMIIQFVSDYGISSNGFKAEVYFSYGENIGCGGEVDLISGVEKNLKSPLINSALVYEKYLDCHWIIKAESDKVIKIEFLSFHIAPCANVNQTALGFSNCSCDMVQVRDGAISTSPVIGTYCGHTIPPRMISSSNIMFIMLYTDGDTESGGFEAKLTTADPECGQVHFVARDSVQHIKSPHFADGYVPRGLHCAYNIAVDNDKTLHIKIVTFDLSPMSTDTMQCLQDKLVVTSSELRPNTTTGRDLVVNSKSILSDQAFKYFEDIQTPKIYTLCGNVHSMDLYKHDYVTLRLVTSAALTERPYKGFDIEISTTDDCMRNITGVQGRVRSPRSSSRGDCYTIIEVPENHTVSVYFFQFWSVWPDSEGYLDILDGASRDSRRLLRAESSDDTLTAFASGRYLTIHQHSKIGISYYLNYMSTDKGRGCGGRLHSDVGMVTSPMYPEQYRLVKSCEFELESLPETKLLLRFQNFDLGARTTCSQVYVELVDRAGSVVRTYCSDDEPADFTSDDNYVKIVYHSTRNTGGPGWTARFIGITP